jgi:glucokinase
MKDCIVLGADIGGSHITVSAVDLHAGTVIEESHCRKHVNPHAAADQIIAEWCSGFSAIIDQYPGKEFRIGIAMPGPFDYVHGISFIKGLSKYESLYGLNVAELLAAHLKLPTHHFRFKNDAACFLQGEIVAGTAGKVEHAIGITLGTGIGTARYHDGTAEDADLWRLPFKGSFAEEYLSTRWFVRRYTELTGKQVKDVKELLSLTEEKQVAAQLFAEFSTDLSVFLEHFVKLDKPQAIVIGGNIAKASEHFLPQLVANLKQRSIETPIIKARAGENAAILGAASCWAAKTIL